SMDDAKVAPIAPQGRGPLNRVGLLLLLKFNIAQEEGFAGFDFPQLNLWGFGSLKHPPFSGERRWTSSRPGSRMSGAPCATATYSLRTGSSIVLITRSTGRPCLGPSAGCGAAGAGTCTSMATSAQPL